MTTRQVRWLFLTAGGLLAAATALSGVFAPGSAHDPGTPPGQHVTAASADWLARAQQHIAEREYRASETSAGLQAPNRAHSLRTWFEPTGVRVHGRTAGDGAQLAELRLAGIGRGDALAAVPAGELVHEGARVEIRREGLVEWYVNSAAGLEQGFTLAESPAGEGPLVLDLAVRGADASLRGDAVELATRAGRRLRYGELVALDAAGRTLVARLEVPASERIRLVVEDAGAAYPIVIDPLLTETPDTTLEGDVPGVFGSSVSGAGDVNGDGYADVIVGNGDYDAGEDNEGAAFVFLGSASGVADGGPPTAHAQLEGGEVEAHLGARVAAAGDVNGDSYDDVIVSAPGFDVPPNRNGAAFVFLGSAAGIASGSASSAATQLDTDQQSVPISSVAGAGDVNDDGYDDVIVGAQFYADGQTTEGAAFVFLGSAAGVADGSLASASARLQSNQQHAQMGRSVAGAGDVNGDDYDDVIVGASAYDAGEENEGAAFVFLGGAAGVADGDPGTAAAQLEADQIGADMGWSVAGAGDVNGDGYDDVIVGALDYDFGKGGAFVFLGSASGVADGDPASAATRIASDQQGAELGGSVDGAGDVNDDGYDDVIVGARRYDTVISFEGSAFVFLGSAAGIADATTPSADAWLKTEQRDAEMGGSVAGAGDVDDDGYDDVIVGAANYDIILTNDLREGAAFIYHGNPYTCSNGLDDDGDGLTDAPADPGCASLSDDTETNLDVACDDGLDNDSDGLIDEGQDPGCKSALSDLENPRCDNDADDDFDGRIDWDGGSGAGIPDPQCTQPYRDKEGGGCGLGFELAPLLLLARGLRRRRSTRP